MYEVEEQCALVDISEQSEIDKISIVPNPAKSYFRVSNPANLNISNINIFDQTGKLVKAEEPVLEIFYIEDLESGLYIVEIEYKTGTYRKKLVIN